MYIVLNPIIILLIRTAMMMMIMMGLNVNKEYYPFGFSEIVQEFAL